MTGTSKSRHERGYGYDHVTVRKNLLYRHIDGSPCFWCDLPLFKDPESNWDEKPLAADHSGANARSGGRADRLLHGRCNSQRQDGSRDAERPAVTDVPPWEWADGTSVRKEPRLGEEELALGTRFMDWPDMK
ncbi:hypothetical protein BH93_11415 [Rhodococcoides fascians A25f]|uniref:hypothetical protein n=1 Tax=Rhodococcoides fascians TaxID=1828 RepID=UPI00068DCE6F|nr:hypothetical protein [Rhodococcus fascians]QII05899.1 hypothetical protein BH93_11415 [Rhodococcus fascians A25f]